jgi:hypothetical protein
MRVDHRHVRRSHERHLAREAFEQHAAQRIDVGAPIHRIAADLLRRDVVDRPDHLVRGRVTHRRHVPGQPEIRQVDVLVVSLGDQRVAGLHIAMHQAVTVSDVQRASELADDPDRAIGLQAAPLPQQHAEVRALHVAHRDK